jgi:hypothetical protein
MESGRRRNQSLNLNLNFQDAYDQQGGTVGMGNSSLFYNMALAYNILFVPKNISVTAAFNGTLNAIGRNNFTTLGPTLAVNSRLFGKRLVAGCSGSYNVSNGDGSAQSNVLNIRWNLAYVIKKKQNIGINMVQQFRNAEGQPERHSIVATMAYSYAF